MDIVVFDLEFTTWEGAMARGWSGAGEHREIVQIGAVRFQPDQDHDEAAFQCLVHPRVNPHLSRYFLDLTGLSQERVDRDGVAASEALARLAAFAGPDALLVSNGDDDSVLEENCRLNGLDNPFAGRCRNIRLLMARMVGHDRYCSGELPALLGFPVPDGASAHDALSDAQAVTGALRTLSRRGLLDVKRDLIRAVSG